MNFFNEPNLSEPNRCGNDMMMDNTTTCCPPACPIYECPQERVVNRYMCYEVPHIIPINTRVINHHIYKHTYQPAYTCCEENVSENIYC
jgi:hypothetical protein